MNDDDDVSRFFTMVMECLAYLGAGFAFLLVLAFIFWS